MNSDRQEGERWSHITPAPRRSIHSYSDMGRYGLDRFIDNNRYIPTGNEQQGYDVVDNVMSKPVRETSPLVIRKKRIQRTNSCPMDEETDDESNVLSKSLPSILPSHLSSSDCTDLEEPNYSQLSNHENTHQRLMNISNQSSNNLRIERSQMNRSDQSFETSQYEQPSNLRRTEQNKTQMNLIIKFSLLIGIMAVLYYCVDHNYSNLFESLQYTKFSKSTQILSSEKIFENKMKDLQVKYNIDSDSILKLKTGISTISARMDAGSFIFVYNSNTKDFNLSHFDKFINEVASAAARYLRNNTSSIKHTVLSSYLDMQEHGELIDMYREAVDKTGVLLVKEVDSVPSDLAMAFHYYCDEYDPLVKRSAILFTLNLANCSNSSEKKSTHEFIEKCLARKWKTVPPENMRPLLTRLVNVIIDVTSAF